jgi:radical SAM superfamily enzyme YgiQ (UPF0313 family)
MRLILVPNPQIVGKRNEEYIPNIPLGLLSLGTVLSCSNIVSVQVLHPRNVDFQSPLQIAEHLLSLEPDVVGFSTMCNTYPFALRTAQLLKQIKPDIVIVFGGPHATVVGKETLNSFAYIDFVLMGECERSIIDFVTYLARHDRKPADIPGLVFRNKNTGVQHTPTYLLLPVDQLPDIDYGLIGDLHGFDSIPLDVGRGCPFRCTFCTTTVYWQQQYRQRSAQEIIKTVQHLKSKYNVTTFDFVHDNFTASSRSVANFCEHILNTGIEFEWSCSARADSVDSKLLDLMYSAGCRGIFMGVESGSPRIQRLCNKKLKLELIEPTIKKALEIGIPPTVSFITGFPYENIDDIEKTLRMMAALNHQGKTKCDLQLHLLSPVPGSQLLNEPNVETALDDVFSDISPAQGFDVFMKNLISSVGKPIFESFYYYVNTTISRQKILLLRFGWFTLFNYFRFTALALEEARRNDDYSLVSVFKWSDLPERYGAEAECCANSLRMFLECSDRMWAASITAILEFELESYRLRLKGSGSCLLDCEYDVNEWIESITKNDSLPVSLPSPLKKRYFVMANGQKLKIASLPV